VADNQLPSLWLGYRDSAAVLDVHPLPELYVTQVPWANALTIGARKPVILLYSGLVGNYSPDEARAVLGHELGHVLSEHTYYRTALVLLSTLMQGSLPVPLVGLPVQALVLMLQEWARAAELSSDRAAALAVGDPLIVCHMLMRMAGGALDGMNLDAFIAQAAEYDDEDDLFARWGRARIEVLHDHPFAVRRVKELIAWVRDGEFDRIRDGAYVHRGQEPPPSAEFERAVAHYRARFVSGVERTVGGAQRLKRQLEDWIQQRTGSGDASD